MTFTRRHLLAGAAAAWLVSPATAADAPTRALRDDAEAALAAGDTAGAQRTLERAAGMAHEADTEMALVRAAMQDGRYREALAMAAHTAGGHADHPAASLLYAWLLAVGGRPLIASRIHARVAERFPGHPLLEAARGAFEGIAVPVPAAALQAPHRLAPHAWGDAPPTRTTLACAGFCNGSHAFVPAAALPAIRRGTALWVRSARGPTVRARLAQSVAEGDVAVLALEAALPGAALADTDALPGVPMAAAGMAPDASPAWPWLFSGFAGRIPLAGGPRSLDVDAPGCLPGTTVIDATGRIAGLAVPGAGRPRWVQAAELAQAGGAAAAAAAPQSSRLAVDTLYEVALSSVVQVLAAAPAR